ncbi:cytochrome c peroxidase [Aureispira sp. CCB-E]|uniref:cytochrome-c peroxidase n=1 Tax=Aureispira sp. CCB-E TaxID=3051121 RepID=UPI00286889E5|nr:cytochrome c peroxidase [Aureispira sp. CCB-E]WMX12004.1 cytochrome c peroxidase [Aureispira sp. CCB-E]
MNNSNNTKLLPVCLLLSIILLGYGCHTKEEPLVYKPIAYQLETGDLPPPNLPMDNPLTTDGVQLGRMLFHEKKLSLDASISCSSCHLQEYGFSDTATFSKGVNDLRGHRQAMSVFNLAWNTNGFFWDGRAELLRHQALLPIQDALEMQETMPSVVAKLQAEQQYRNQFFLAFGDETITEERIALALEQFMFSIVSVDSKYDRHLRGEVALTTAEQRGKDLFFNEYNPSFPAISGADCAHCHSGKNFENDDYMNNGLDSIFTDNGREKATLNSSDKAKFKVPSLRNIALTAPYMHDGRFKTLEEVVQHYNTGLINSPTIDPALLYPYHNGGLMLSNQDIQDLIAFLKTLTDDKLAIKEEYSSPF